jgi:hypothetical protein
MWRARSGINARQMAVSTLYMIQLACVQLRCEDKLILRSNLHVTRQDLNDVKFSFDTNDLRDITTGLIIWRRYGQIIVNVYNLLTRL